MLCDDVGICFPLLATKEKITSWSLSFFCCFFFWRVCFCFVGFVCLFFPYGLMLLKRKGRLGSWLNVLFFFFLICLAVVTTFSNSFAHYVYMSLDLRLQHLQVSFGKSMLGFSFPKSMHIHWKGNKCLNLVVVVSFYVPLWRKKHFQRVQAPQLLTMQTIKGIAISLRTRRTDWILATCHVTRDKSIFQWLW